MSLASTDTLGCSLTTLLRDQSLQAGQCTILRKTSHPNAKSRVEMWESPRGFLLGVALSSHRRQIMRNGRMAHFDFAPDTIYLRNFAEPYRADMVDGFDFLLVEMPAAALASAGEEPCDAALLELPALHAEVDLVLPHLARALVPVLGGPQATSPLFLDHVLLAIQKRVLGRFGTRVPSPRRRTLSRAQEARAKELLAANPSGNLLVGDIAAACGMSRSVFMRAFRETTGATPHQWLLRQRIAAAKRYLAMSNEPLADIALRCGFADQSHFTHAFSRHVGAPPGLWRSQR